MRQRAWIGLTAAVAVAASLLISLSASMGRDYPGPPCTGCDYAGPPIDALAHGHLSAFFAAQPFMGSVTLLLRAPLARLVGELGGNELWQFRIGSLACLLVLGFFACALAAVMRRRGQGPLPQLAVVGLVMAGPMTFKALEWGHPEELVGAGLSVAAVILAGRGRAILAGLMLGLAIATKQWALLAVLPVLIAAGKGRAKLLWTAAPVAAALLFPMLLGDPSRFVEQNLHAGLADGGVTPTNLWWIFHYQSGIDLSAGGGMYSIPAWLARAAHPVLIGLCLGLSVLYWRPPADGGRRLGRHPLDALGLLALLFLLRCLLDPLAASFHHVPFVVALAAYEGLRRRGMPLVSLASALALWLIAAVVAPLGDPNLLNLVYLAWALPTVAYLGVLAFSARATMSLRHPRLDDPAPA